MAISAPTSSSSSLFRSSYLFPLPPSLSPPLQPKKSLPLRRRPSFSPPSTSSSSKPRRVSTAPVQRSPAPGLDSNTEISRLQTLISRLRKANSLREKLRILDTDDRVRDFFAAARGLPPVLDARDEFLVKCLVAAGQGHVLGPEMRSGRGGGGGLREALVVVADAIARWGGDEGVGGGGVRGKFEKLMGTLSDVEEFYDCVGGIIG